MKTQSHFQKNSEYDKVQPPDDSIPMFIGVVDIKGTVYDGEIFRVIGQWGKEELILCLKKDSIDAPF